jgi:hypothetical protein
MPFCVPGSQAHSATSASLSGTLEKEIEELLGEIVPGNQT